MQTDQTIDVQTSILEPIIHNETFIKFQLDNKGILHSNSKIQLCLKAPDAGRFLPFTNGIGAVVRRCCLYAGSKIIAEVDDWNHFHAYKSMFLSNESKKERETILTGRVGTYEYDYDDTAANLSSSTLKLDVGRDYSGNAVSLPKTLDISNGQTFQINLSDLFPFLKQTQLPLYLMQEDISVELHLEDKVHRYFAKHGDVDSTAKIAAVAAQDVKFDHTKTKFIADYMLYPQDQMDNYARQVETQGLTIPYYDYLLTRTTLQPDSSDHLQFVRTVGGANRICTKLIIANTVEQGNANLDTIDNIYNSVYKTVGNVPIKIQIKYNDRNLFPRPLENQALLFNHVQACEGVPPFITKLEYDGTHAGMISTDTVEGHDFRAALQAAPKNYLAFNLTRNERVNSRGVELHIDMPLARAAPGTTYTQRVWLEVAKVITLKNGRMMCTEA
eukprot:COSAG03_NODE_2174_length_3048_cov_1.355036_2_plen_444_part_00